jgi:hypothetical protein
VERTRNVRLSVRELTEEIDATHGTTSSSWNHVRYQRFTVWPLKPDTRVKMSRDGLDAHWMAQGRAKPEVEDTARLVALDSDGQPTMIFKVEKVFVEGRTQKLYLKEIAEVQS